MSLRDRTQLAERGDELVAATEIRISTNTVIPRHYRTHKMRFPQQKVACYAINSSENQAQRDVKTQNPKSNGRAGIVAKVTSMVKTEAGRTEFTQLPYWALSRKMMGN